VTTSGPRLIDMMGLIAGYGTAALLMRAFWPASGLSTPLHACMLFFEYFWLGLAMSGPVLVGWDRREHRDPAASNESGGASTAGSRRTKAEIAWLMIGAYWIGLTILATPGRLPVDTRIVLVFQILIVVLAAIVPPGRKRLEANGSTWTHKAAVGLLAAWPLAWIDLVALSLD
jgi:hypothetical protein